MRFVCLLWACLSFKSAVFAEHEYKIVSTPQGKLKGFKESGVYVFYGIPYATVQTGENKFKAPLPGPSWSDIHEAVEKNIVCKRPDDSPVPNPDHKTEEDCLVAHVFTPDTEETNLPVVVYVHGGAFLFGYGNDVPPHDLVNRGKFIAVLFNYRLAVHGFLCLRTEKIPGNAGLKDQVALLNWVKDNIASFGGNPDEVTLTGCSAGSASIELLLLSETTRGLFKRVVPESGSALGGWSIQRDPIDNARQIARRLGFDKEDIEELEQFYINTPLDEMYPVILEMAIRQDGDIILSPCIENDIDDAFLKDSPYNIMKQGNFPKLPTLIGLTNMDGLFRYEFFELWKDEMNENFADFLPVDLFIINETERQNVAQEVKEFYFKDQDVSENSFLSYVDYFTDAIFATGIMKSVRLNIEAGNSEVYLYEYSHPNRVLNIGNTEIYGADHCAQHIFIVQSESQNENNETRNLRRALKDTWINFFHTGKPVLEANSNYPEGWPVSSSEGAPYMELKLPLELNRNRLLGDRMDFWYRIYEKYYWNPAQNLSDKAAHCMHLYLYVLFLLLLSMF